MSRCDGLFVAVDNRQFPSVVNPEMLTSLTLSPTSNRPVIHMPRGGSMNGSPLMKRTR